MAKKPEIWTIRGKIAGGPPIGCTTLEYSDGQFRDLGTAFEITPEALTAYKKQMSAHISEAYRAIG